jgi:hypothetical protein
LYARPWWTANSLTGWSKGLDRPLASETFYQCRSLSKSRVVNFVNFYGHVLCVFFSMFLVRGDAQQEVLLCEEVAAVPTSFAGSECHNSQILRQ